MKYLKHTFFLFAILTGIIACKKEIKLANTKEIKPTTTKVVEKTSNADLGLKYAMTTKAQLGKNLLGTIKNKGTEEALIFCNVRAFTLTDSMAVVQKVAIKRVSDKPRNANNKANMKEMVQIEKFKKDFASGKKIEPVIESLENDSIQFYYPIITNKMCLQCHGVPNKDIKPTVIKKITDLYPTDKAIGYSENQVRGIWNVKMKNQEN